MSETLVMPLLPLRDVVVFPSMVMPLFVGRKESIHALNHVMDEDKQIFLLTQKTPSANQPKRADLYKVGVMATVLQMLRLPDGTVKILVEGLQRAKLVRLRRQGEYSSATVTLLEDERSPESAPEVAGMRAVLKQFDAYIKTKDKIPKEVLVSLNAIEDPAKLSDSVASHLSCKLIERQKLLETPSVIKRLTKLSELLHTEIELDIVEKRIKGRVKKQVEKNQTQYYLNEQLKAIQKEMGDLEEGSAYDEIGQLEEKIEKSGMPKDAIAKAKNELAKLKNMPPMSAEAAVSRNYLEWLVDVPWKKMSTINQDITHAQTILDDDHYGLEKVKERILEYLAVQRRVKKVKGAILCLVGPPGVGKTSLGQSIANATGREFVRVALGGVRDEAEIRGHRRTYIGALPGKVIQKIAKTKVKNPLFMLDEVDKMAMDFRGDPASALLEVLDPEQNHAFNDHYLEVDYDLSDVLFIATANSLDIPPALLDRMEVIRLAGYTEDEKLHIAQDYLVPRQIEANGLTSDEIAFTEEALRDVIRYYTREAGVRNVEREISKICRKVVRKLLVSLPDDKKSKASKKKKTDKATVEQLLVGPADLEEYLGVRRFRYGLAEERDRVGQVTGMAWTEVGGELLTIEAQIMTGKGSLIYTGRLGDVMQESIQAALTVVRSRSTQLNVKKDYFQKHDFHVHVPEGATPKDGPSAGVGMCVALVSALTGIPVRADVAMTGEITLRGEVLPIGGLKEKLLAALRGGIKRVLIPLENERDLKEIPDNVKAGLEIIPVRWADQVLDLALQRPLDNPMQLSDEGADLPVPVIMTEKPLASNGSEDQAH